MKPSNSHSSLHPRRAGASATTPDTFQIAALVLRGIERICILTDAGDGWIKVVLDFPPHARDQAEKALAGILQRTAGFGRSPATESKKRTFHHPI